MHFFSGKSGSSRSPFQFSTHLLRATLSLESRQAHSTDASTCSPKIISHRSRLARTDNTALPSASLPGAESAPAGPPPTSKCRQVARPALLRKSDPESAITARSGNTNVPPSSVISNPAAPSGLPTNRFPIRRATGSAAPEAETPIGPNPSRPKSCTVVSSPGARTSIKLMRSPAS